MRSTYQNLRLVKAAVFAEYLANTQLWRSIGNAAFADLIRQHATETLLPKPPTDLAISQGLRTLPLLVSRYV